MNSILKLLQFIFGGFIRMTEKKKYDNSEINEMQNVIIENHKRIIEEEECSRKAIYSTTKSLNKIIEKDNISFKAELVEESARRNREFEKLESELEIALKNDDIEKINIITKNMKDI